MEQEQIIAGNKLIARFVSDSDTAYSNTGDFVPDKYGNRDAEATFYAYADMQFHTSWDWLMPVVEKIEALNFGFNGDLIQYFMFKIENKYCLIQGVTNVRQPGVFYQTPYEFEPASKIHATYLAVTDFITWYNSQPCP